LQIDPIDLAEYFGYSLQPKVIELPQWQGRLDRIPELVEDLSLNLTRMISRNEQSKRELLISPIVQRVIANTQALIRIEYAVNVSNQLQGNVDYLLSLPNLKELLVIEAKRDDLDYGFTQLTAELIGLDQWERSPSVEQQPVLVGALATGQAWIFGVLHRQEKRIEQGLNLYTLPEDTETLVRILINCLIDGAPE
jgi:hypothetical protein